MSSQHDARFQRWKSGIPGKTRFLAELLAAELTSVMEAAGFKKVDLAFGRPDSPVDGRRLQFERTSGAHLDVVYAFFDKYASPRFQIGFSRRAQADPDRILRSGHVVRRSAEYYHEWGKPRWWPVNLWTSAQARSSVDASVRSADQVFRFLETGERGPNISREVKISAGNEDPPPQTQGDG